MELLIAALSGGAVAAVAVTWYNQWKKDEKARQLRSAVKSVETVAAMNDGGDAIEAAKRKAEEAALADALRAAVAKL